MRALRILFCIILCFVLSVGQALSAVFISEVMWMGSDLSTADEWLELFADSDTDISGWNLTSLNSKGEETALMHFQTGTLLGSGTYTVIANYDAANSRLSADPAFVTKNLSLPNTKLLLRIRDSSGIVIDAADDGVGVPFAGINASGTGTRASMERIVFGSGSKKEHWSTAIRAMGFDAGAPLLGTPGFPREEKGETGGSSSAGSTGSSSSEAPFGDHEPPTEAKNLSGHVLSGSLILTWSRSDSSDLFLQILSLDPRLRSGLSGTLLGPATETYSFTGALEDVSYAVTLRSSDPFGNISSGVSISVQPLPKLKITEVLSNPIGEDREEWIEMANFGVMEISLIGITLEDGHKNKFFVQSLSGSTVLAPGGHRSFRKSLTGLALDNKGEEIRLWKGADLLDAFAYTETAEEVSVGRDPADPGILRAFCVPSEGKQNVVLPLPAFISIQTGAAEAAGKVTLNLEAQTLSGSLASATCAWNYGDGFLSESCNPPSHTFSAVGDYSITLSVTDYCSNTVVQTLPVRVLPAGTAASKKKKTEPPSAIPPGGFGGGISCDVERSDGLKISEFIPDPLGDEVEEEWIELQNTGIDSFPLCGYVLDDAEEGSKTFRIGSEMLPPGGYRVFRRPETGIALNNDQDAVRILSPAGVTLDSVSFVKPFPGESYARRSDGNFVWTPFLTPGAENRFRTAERRFVTDRAIVSAALPNPVSRDEEGEWIEITNVSDDSLALTDWKLDNAEGGSKPFLLKGILLASKETRRFSIQETRIQLRNSSDTVRLLDPDGNTASILGWTEAEEGRIYRPYAFSTERVKAQVTNVVDGDTVDIALTDVDNLDRIPEEIRRLWLALDTTKNPHIRVRMIGIDTPETVHPSKAVQQYGMEASNYVRSLILDKNVELEFDTEIWDKYQRLLAYVYFDGALIQAKILQRGLAYAYRRYPFLRSAEFQAFEAEAKRAKLGIWSDPEAEAVVTLLQEESQTEKPLEGEDLLLAIRPESGMVSSGTTVEFQVSQPSRIFLSIDSGSFAPFSGSLILSGPLALGAYAESEIGTGLILRSNRVSRRYEVFVRVRTGAILMSEIFPSPESGEAEWVEFWNRTSRDVSLAGWQLDDIQNGGSRPWTIPENSILPGNGFLVLRGGEWKLKFNNDGDEAWLLMPDGAPAASLPYPTVKKGLGFGLTFSGNIIGSCMTDPTPGRENTCVPEKIAAAKIMKSPKQNLPRKSSTTKNQRRRKRLCATEISFRASARKHRFCRSLIHSECSSMPRPGRVILHPARVLSISPRTLKYWL